ncbi:hypothetical protein BOX15_Mlig000675g2 [Macrostomum lignano]|uniref:ShKT domain-containing protein n=2 Tax=Macrostomum lignano TaxID=282301 RepID=A0A267GX85_9PLAT|nr:hypothetical protein BOX15_Mlig000675g2 [Macrostomum lignano]
MLNVPLANQTILKRLKNSFINSRNKTNVTVSGGEIKQLLGGGEIKQPLGGGEIKQPLGGGGGEIKQPLGGGGGEIKQPLGGGEIKQPLGGGGGEIKQPLGDGGGEIKQPLGGGGGGGEIKQLLGDGGGEIKQPLGGVEIKRPLGGGEIKQPLGDGGGEIKQPLGGGGGEIKQPLGGGGGGEIKQPLGGGGGGEIKQPLGGGGGEIKQPLGGGGGGGEIKQPPGDGGGEIKQLLGGGGGEIKQPLGGGGSETKQPLGDGGGEIKQPLGGGEIKQPLGGGGGGGGGGEIKQPLGDGGGEIKQPLGGGGVGGEINHNISKSQQPNPYLPKRTDFVNLGQLPRVPVGREIYAEFSVIIDQTWIDSLTLAYAIDRDSALVFTTELIHYAQVWYLHPSLGYRLWLRVSYVTVLNGSQSEPENFDFIKFCTSQSEWKRSFQPDFVLILTGNKRHCNGLGGVAFPSEACNSKLKARQCACVHHQKLQANTLIRAIAHEIGHLIGMPDDYAGRSSELCYSGLMRYGLYEDSGWSTCAVQNLERYLFIKDNTCLHRSETPSLSESPSPPPLPLNTAWRAPAWQSSTANDDEFVWGAWKATDGHIFGVPHENTVGKTENLLGHLGSCSQTKVEFKPWLVIELDSQLDTSNSSEELQVQVYGREECCEHHLSNLSIGIGNQRHPHGHHVCRIFENMEHFGKYKLLSFKCPATGKYLSIQSTSRENVSLSVCEVYVFQDQPARPFSHAGQTCFDKARYCDEWKMAGDCDTAHRADCRRTCGLCGPAARLKRGQPQPSPAKRQPCKDSHRYCRFFAANGLCEEKWPHCPLACDRCNSENPAASQIYLAPPKVRAPVAESTDTVTITTTTNTVAMATEAMATASSTVVESATDKQQHVECTDKDSDCQHWAGALYCQFPHIADKHCRKSCGTCS